MKPHALKPGKREYVSIVFRNSYVEAVDRERFLAVHDGKPLREYTTRTDALAAVRGRVRAERQAMAVAKRAANG